MGQAINTVGFVATAAAAGGTAVTMADGDSATLPTFPTTATARLVQLFRHDETGNAGIVQVKSPNLANSSTGIKVATDQSPSVALLPGRGLEKLVSGDTLSILLGSAGTATKTTAGGLLVAYSTLAGATAKLHSWGDISGAILHVFTQEVALKTGAAGEWKDLLANSTSDLMETGYTYALLGYDTTTNYCLVGIKSPETSTRRICGPGTTATEDTSSYFIELSTAIGAPGIPVVAAGNRGNINVSALSGKATTTGKVSLIWAQLTGSFT